MRDFGDVNAADPRMRRPFASPVRRGFAGTGKRSDCPLGIALVLYGRTKRAWPIWPHSWHGPRRRSQEELSYGVASRLWVVGAGTPRR